MNVFIETPEHACPHCGHRLNRAAFLDEHDVAAPRPGDTTVCAYCCALLIVGPHLALRELTAEDRAALSPRQARDLVEAQRWAMRARASQN